MSTSKRTEPPAFTPLWEQRLISAAKRGDCLAEARLLELYGPMVRRIAGSLYLPGGEREDVAQEARLGILAAIRAWDPGRSVPFRCFAWLCGLREANTAVNAARAAEHQPLNRARSPSSSAARWRCRPTIASTERARACSGWGSAL